MKYPNHWKLVPVSLALGTLLACVISASAGASVDPGQRTVSAGAFQVQWSQTDPEGITSLSWNGSPNLTNSWTNGFCPQGGDLEFFGNSWDTNNDFSFQSLVGWGSSGNWGTRDPNGVSIGSSDSGCFGTSGVPVQTSYQFFNNGPEVNRILVQRRFSFGTTPFPYDLRAYSRACTRATSTRSFSIQTQRGPRSSPKSGMTVSSAARSRTGTAPGSPSTIPPPAAA